MQEKKNWYWEKKLQKQVIVFPTHTIVHPCLYIFAVKHVHDIPISVSNRNKKIQALKIYPTFLTDSYHDYIIDEILHRDKIEFETNISAEDGK